MLLITLIYCVAVRRRTTTHCVWTLRRNQCVRLQRNVGVRQCTATYVVWTGFNNTAHVLTSSHCYAVTSIDKDSIQFSGTLSLTSAARSLSHITSSLACITNERNGTRTR